MRHRFFREAKGTKPAPVSTEAGESSRSADPEVGLRHKLFMAGFVVILAAAMIGWLFVLIWGITKLVSFF
jgi:type VI protein secretion system component VasF